MSPRARNFTAAAVMATLGACGRRAPLPPPPPLFPAATAWTAVFPEAVESAALEGGHLLVLTRGGTLRALDPATGAPVWEAAESAGALSAGSALVLLRDAEGHLRAVDPATGSLRWQADTGIRGGLAALVGPDHVVVAGEEGVAGFDPASGTRRWWHPSAPVRAATLQAGVLLLSEADGSLRRRDPASGASLWVLAPGGAGGGPAAIDTERGRAYLGASGRGFVALDLEDGSREWRWRMAAAVPTEPTLLGSRVLFAALDDVLWALERGGGSMAWRADLPSRPITGPVRVGSAVVVACHGSRPDRSVLLAFDGRTGASLGSLATPAPLQPPLLAAEGRLYVPLRDGRVLAVSLRGA